MLVETLRANWAARATHARVSALPELSGGALTLGAGTSLGDPDATDRVAEADRAIALLSVALGRPLDASQSAHARRALAKARDGDAPLALTHLALAGLGRLDDPREDARRLFIADGLMKAGVSPRRIVEALGAPTTQDDLERGYNPDQPRVPAGSGRPSGQWTNGDWEEEGNDAEHTPEVEPPSDSDDAEPTKPILIVGASENWAQYLDPVDTAEAAERTGAPFNGDGPNMQHARGVEIGMRALRDLGYEIVVDHAYAVNVPGFATPRVYDYIAKNPATGQFIGAEVKTTKFSTIFFNLFQVEKDVAVGELDGVDLPELKGRLTTIVYQTMCDGCENLNFRTAYLLMRLRLARVQFQYIYKMWGDRE